MNDSELVRELADRRTVLDVCPISNLRVGAVGSLEEHPLPDLVTAGVLCSLSSDDPALFGTSLEHEHETARSLLVSDPKISTKPGSRALSATPRPANASGARERRSRGRRKTRCPRVTLSEHCAVPGRQYDATIGDRERLDRRADGLGDCRLT